WTASTDNVGVAGYKIYRNGTQVGTATGTTYTDTGLGSSTSYTYTVSAYDAAGNNSAQSAAVIGTTQTPQAGPVITSFTANPTSIGTGGSSTLSWSVSGNPAPTLSINNGVGTVTGTSVVVHPTVTTTYTLTATNSVSTATAMATVTVTDTQAPTVPT